MNPLRGTPGTPIPAGFLQPEFMEASLPGTETLDSGDWRGTGTSIGERSLLILICHMWSLLSAFAIPLSANAESKDHMWQIKITLIFQLIDFLQSQKAPIPSLVYDSP